MKFKKFCMMLFIECYVIEKRSLGDDRSHDILLVKNVTDLGNKTYYYEV